MRKLLESAGGTHAASPDIPHTDLPDLAQVQQPVQ
jgi:hypothetical protein